MSAEQTIHTNINTDRVDAAFRLELQLNRCSETSSWENGTVFEKNVDTLLKQLPIQVKLKVHERSDEWNVTTEEYVYERNAGHKLGSVEEPYLDHNGHVYSPKLMTKTFKDYNVIFETILEELEKFGMTYKTSRETQDFGDVKPKKKQVKTPT